MSRTQQIIWAVVVVVVIIGIYWWWSSAQNQQASMATNPFTQATTSASTGTTQPASSGSTGSTTAAPLSATVTFNGTSFSPSSVTIAQGGTVTWVSSGGNMWVASDPHPIHNGYDGTTLQQHCASDYQGPAPLDECQGSSANWAFTFNKIGTWGYHDHLQASIMGSVTVVAEQ